MKPNHVLILMILGAAMEEGCRAYLQNHSLTDSIISGLRVASLTMLTGLAPSPMQSKFDALQTEALGQSKAFGVLSQTGGVQPTEQPHE